MQDHMLDILIYLFENYMDNAMGLLVNSGKITTELEQAGFESKLIKTVFAWLQIIWGKNEEAQTSHNLANSQGSRVYHNYEKQRLDVDSRGLLEFLERQKIIDPEKRELIIDRALALDEQFITTEHVKWVVMLVLMNGEAEDLVANWINSNQYKSEITEPYQ
jgi:Smg protein